ncbi:DUF2341 domain-containing protein [Chitinophaga lutea]
MKTTLVFFACCMPLLAFGQSSRPWKYHRDIRINTAVVSVAGDISDYPLAVSLDAKRLDFTQARANGADIRFSLPGENGFLPHSVEWWDPVARKALVWVKVPIILGNSAKQIIRMHWGNNTAPAEDHSNEIFSVAGGFVGVWHLNEAGNTLPDGYKDATANSANATGIRMAPTSQADGVLGKAQLFDYAERQWIMVDSAKSPLFDLTNQLTFSIWAKARSYANKGDEARRVLPGYETMIAKGDNSWRLQKFGPRSWHKPEADLIEICCERLDPRGDLCLVGKVDLKPGEWFHLTGVHDHPNLKLYVNGLLDTVVTFDSKWKTDHHPVGIGNQSQFPDKGGRNWDGWLDEARVINVVKSADWIRLDYESQRPDSRLLEFGQTSSN